MKNIIKLIRKIFNTFYNLQKKLKRIKQPLDINLLNGYPIERDFGSNRGKPLDRYYIEEFIEKNRSIIRGKVLEIGDDRYSKKYLDNSQINVLRGKNNRNYINHEGDLLDFNSLKSIGKFDTLILTNVINFIYEYDIAIKNIAKLITKDGKCLFSVSGLSGLSKFDNERWGDYWRFSEKSLYLSLKKHFHNVEIDYFGNASVAAASILGIVTEDLPESTLKIKDYDYPVIIVAIASQSKYINN